ncbi:ATP-binding protein [Actinomadura decatromicini]|uniref:ATP-binding protein n=2 Tax=Actinomadura decatromicini TaxID=2604572 RepID=A0A5D3FDX4_9ACTN|nr:ATP-binding protein [Actinomadura decatromicini]
MDLAIAPLQITSAAKVPAARRKIRNFAASVVSADAADDVELMVSEAMANALIHGLGGALVTVIVTEKALRVEVRDHGPGFIIAGRVDHGRGLAIINALAPRWKSDADERGTCLWFEVDREVGL